MQKKRSCSQERLQSSPNNFPLTGNHIYLSNQGQLLWLSIGIFHQRLAQLHLLWGFFLGIDNAYNISLFCGFGKYMYTQFAGSVHLIIPEFFWQSFQVWQAATGQCFWPRSGRLLLTRFPTISPHAHCQPSCVGLAATDWRVPASARDTCNRCGAVKQGLSGDIFGMIGGNGPSHSGRVRWAFYRFETWEEHSWNWRRIRKIFRNASKEFDTLVECDHLCLFKETPVNVSKKATCVKFALYWAVFSWSCALWVSYIGLLKCYHVYQSQWIHKEVDTTHIYVTRKCYLIICIKRQAQIPAIYVSKELWPRKCVGKC